MMKYINDFQITCIPYVTLYDCETGGNNENWLVEIKQKPVMHDVNEWCCHKTSTAKYS